MHPFTMEDFSETLHPSAGPHLHLSAFGLEEETMGVAFLRAHKVACVISRNQFEALSKNRAFRYNQAEGAYVLHGGDIDVYVYENYKGKGAPAMKVDLGSDAPTLLRGGMPNIQFIDLTNPKIETPLTQYFLHQYMKWNRQLHPLDYTAAPVHVEAPYKPEPFAVVGDLDGRYTSFEKLSQEAGIIDSKGRWIAGSKKAVYLGDILADRGTDGFRILESIASIKQQAKEQGGDVFVLMGNHDEFMTGYLTEIFENLGSVEMAIKFHNDETGKLDELMPFGDIRNPGVIRENMKRHEVGLQYLRRITQMNIVGKVGDSLFFHTPPNKAMLEAVLGNSGDIDENIRMINQKWRENLESLFFRRGNIQDINDPRVAIYKQIAGTFLHTGNTTRDDQIARGGNGQGESVFYSAPDLYSKLYTAGIRNIYSGHTNAALPEYIAGIRLRGMNKKAYRSE